jgi:outer membrane protein assembly factor BamD (BamD/ComL family)
MKLRPSRDSAAVGNFATIAHKFPRQSQNPQALAVLDVAYNYLGSPGTIECLEEFYTTNRRFSRDAHVGAACEHVSQLIRAQDIDLRSRGTMHVFLIYFLYLRYF